MANVTIRFEDAADVHLVLISVLRCPKSRAAIERDMKRRGIVGHNLIESAMETISQGIDAAIGISPTPANHGTVDSSR